MPIKIKHIWKSYGEQRVLADFSLTVEDGEKICLMGASGIGKTTILSILAGLVKPDFGEIEGMEGKKLSMVFQEDRLLEWADAFENVALPHFKYRNFYISSLFLFIYTILRIPHITSFSNSTLAATITMVHANSSGVIR